MTETQLLKPSKQARSPFRPWTTATNSQILEHKARRTDSIWRLYFQSRALSLHRYSCDTKRRLEAVALSGPASGDRASSLGLGARKYPLFLCASPGFHKCSA